MRQRSFLTMLYPSHLLMTFILVSLMVISSTSVVAQEMTGATPESAWSLTVDGADGQLEVFAQDWYSFTPTVSGEVTLELAVTADNDRAYRFVSLKLFPADQMVGFMGETRELTTLGVSTAKVNKIVWQGELEASETYYIQLFNESDYPVQYQLTATELAPESAPEPTVLPELSDTPIVKLPSNGPLNPTRLMSGLTMGKLGPGETYWYSFRHDDFSGYKRFKELDFSMFFTPDNGHRRHHVNFELFRKNDFVTRVDGSQEKINNFGAGMQTSRDGDYNTGERIWRGVVMMGHEYLLEVQNGTGVEIDYWIYDNDIYNPILGPVEEAAPAMVFSHGAAPQTARPLKIGLNKERLAPGEEAWYEFTMTDFSKEKGQHEMALTMITTPDDGNLIWDMLFDVFVEGETWHWSPGDNSRMNNIGTGSVVYRDNNPLTGERFWNGWVLDNVTYYVQIRNGTDIDMDYWLYTGDVYSPELGEKTVMAAPVKVDPGTAPYAALDLELGTNKGQLEPKTERWYKFVRGDGTYQGQIETIFTLHFVPDDGNRIWKVNIELFDEPALRDWGPDNRFNIVPFGQGNAVSRDNNDLTGELVWKGHVQTGNVYYMRVTNESDETIDYKVYPDDVVEANLD
ncbi:hypothetical protein QUF63_02120 [Anaerolineales bacterium HSG25]|nr:hypothetical protein [Anaerolineales bacterium HSG25]